MMLSFKTKLSVKTVLGTRSCVRKKEQHAKMILHAEMRSQQGRLSVSLRKKEQHAKMRSQQGRLRSVNLKNKIVRS